MIRSGYSILLLLLLILNTSTTTAQLATANGESRLLFVEAGSEVIFKGTAHNADHFQWDFERDIAGPSTRWFNDTQVNYTLYAAGVYNATFRAYYDNGSVKVHQLIVIVTYEEPPDEPDRHRALFLAVAGSELITSSVLLALTLRLRHQKIYL